MDLMKLAQTGLGKNATQNSMLAAYSESAIGEKKSAWKTAVVVYKTVKHERFKEFFETRDKYAELIGYTKGYVSKQVRAVECYGELLKVDETFEGVSVGFVTELLALSKEVTSDILTDFIQTEGVDCTETRDSIRQKVKDYKNIISGGGNAYNESESKPENETKSKPEDETKSNPEDDVVTAMPDNLVLIDDNFGNIVVNNMDLKEAIYELLREYGYEI